MKVDSNLTALTLTAKNAIEQPMLGGVSFEKILNAVQGKNDMHEALQKMSNKLLSQKEMAPRELLQYQLMANAFHVKVELVSKVAESASATLKKLQNN